MTEPSDERKAVLHLEDLAVGRRFQSGEAVLERDEVVAFAERFDPQPFHLDEELAGVTLFKGLAASGWHTAALTMRLLVGSLPFAGGLVGLGVELRWPAPARPGDVLRVESEIIAIDPPRKTSGVVTVRSRTVNGRGEVVQETTARLLVNARGAAA